MFDSALKEIESFEQLPEDLELSSTWRPRGRVDRVPGYMADLVDDSPDDNQRCSAPGTDPRATLRRKEKLDVHAISPSWTTKGGRVDLENNPVGCLGGCTFSASRWLQGKVTKKGKRKACVRAMSALKPMLATPRRCYKRSKSTPFWTVAT